MTSGTTTPLEDLPSGTPQPVPSLDKGGGLASGRASGHKNLCLIIPMTAVNKISLQEWSKKTVWQRECLVEWGWYSISNVEGMSVRRLWKWKLANKGWDIHVYNMPPIWRWQLDQGFTSQKLLSQKYVSVPLKCAFEAFDNADLKEGCSMSHWVKLLPRFSPTQVEVCLERGWASIRDCQNVDIANETDTERIVEPHTFKVAHILFSYLTMYAITSTCLALPPSEDRL